MLDPKVVLQLLADSPVAMAALDAGSCAIEHVHRRDPNGPDVRLDTCPCDRVLPDGQVPFELGGGQYVSSERHTIGDLIRDVAE